MTSMSLSDKSLEYLKRSYMSRWDVIRLRYRLIRLMQLRTHLPWNVILTGILLSFLLYLPLSSVLGFPEAVAVGAGIVALFSAIFFHQVSLTSPLIRLDFLAMGFLTLQVLMLLTQSLTIHVALGSLNKKKSSRKKRQVTPLPKSIFIKNVLFALVMISLVDLFLYFLARFFITSPLLDELKSFFDEARLLDAFFTVEIILLIFLVFWLPVFFLTRYFVRDKVIHRSLHRLRQSWSEYFKGYLLAIVGSLVLTIAIALILISIVFQLKYMGVLNDITGVIPSAGEDSVQFIAIFVLVSFSAYLDVLHVLVIASIYLTPKPLNLIQLLEEHWMQQEFTIFRVLSGGTEEELSCPNCYSPLFPPFIANCPFCPSLARQQRNCPRCQRPLRFSPIYCPYCHWEARRSPHDITKKMMITNPNK